MPDSQRFSYRVSLTHVPSGRTVVFDDEWAFPGYVRGDDWEFDPVFIWSDGNYSCNCNRDLFFHRNNGRPDYDHVDDGLGCADYDEYRVNYLQNNETGRVIYKEE